MFVPFDLMQQKDSAIAIRELLNRASQCYAINGARQPVILAAILSTDLSCILAVGFVQRNLFERFLAEVHQYGIHRDAVEPSRQSRVSAESFQLTENLHK